MSFPHLHAQEWKTVRFADLDTSTIQLLNQTETYSNGQTKSIGWYRHIRLNSGAIKEYYLPVGRDINYRKNGKIKDVQHYTQSGFMMTDTTFRRNGKLKRVQVYKVDKSSVQSNGKDLYLNDRFFQITFYFRNGNIESEGLAESERNAWLHRKDTWKVYRRDGSFKCELKYKSSGLTE
jgi:antitoxin component YwqK of YwqJK toxin-antitoxin module